MAVLYFIHWDFANKILFAIISSIMITKAKRGRGFNHTLTSRKNLVSGFTLLEILLVIGIIAVLAGIVILAINPNRQLASVRNTQRKSNLAEINKALYQYYIDNSRYPVSVTSTLTEICNTGATTTGHSLSCVGLADLSYLVPTYLVAIPTDPQSTASSTKYSVMKDTANKIALYAGQAESNDTVSLGNVVIPFVCGSTLTDTRDSKTYTTVLIGTQCWMQQNLNVGTLVTGVTTQTDNSVIEKYCYDNSEANCTTYGGLYQWDEMMNYVTTAGAQGICLTGWHVPTDEEYKTLEVALGMCTDRGSEPNLCADDSNNERGLIPRVGDQLKDTGLCGGRTPCGTSGFQGLLAGRYWTDGSFMELGLVTRMWTSSELSSNAWRRDLSLSFATVGRYTVGKNSGFSVRCLED
jgi:uncharacterized protein (TIGR02145 family)/prepilin-type N-terminal cleavage/methylation domain-containing protein